MAKGKELTEITSKEMAELTKIREDHLQDIKKLTPDERREFSSWLSTNIGLVADWTGIDIAHAKVALILRGSPSMIDWDNNKRGRDLQKWSELKKGPLTTLYNALDNVYTILSEPLIGSETDEILDQTLRKFAPKDDSLRDWLDAVGNLRDVAESALRYNGESGTECLPDWVRILMGYLQYQDRAYTWKNYKALMLVFGFWNNEGKTIWPMVKKEEKGPEYERPWELLPGRKPGDEYGKHWSP